MDHISQAPGAEADSLVPAPRRLRAWARVTRWLLGLVATAWAVFFLTWLVLHAAIVPRIDQWRPDLERWASRAMGLPVTVGDIRAVATAPGPLGLPPLMPAFELRDLRVADAAGRPALALPRVLVAVSPRSLWRGGVEQLVIDAPALDVRRTADGRIEVAGIDLGRPAGGGQAAADWFFDQPEVAVRGGTVRWTDERRAQPPLALEQLDFVARNTARRHTLRLDATPPADWGDRFSLRARLREPLLDFAPRAPGEAVWQRWDGELYAELPRADVARLRHHADLSEWGVAVRAGQGRLQAWADVVRGRVAGGAAAVALRDVDVQLGRDLPPLALTRLEGQLAGQWSAEGFSVGTDALSFTTREGVVWPGGRVRVSHSTAPRLAGTEVTADGVELAALTALAERLPLPTPVHDWLARLRPAGRVDGLSARWQGPDAQGLQAKGRVVGLFLTGEPSGRMSISGRYPLPGRPGVEGALVEFDAQRHAGRARVLIERGAVSLPGVFEDERVPLDRLEARGSWRLDGDRIDVTLDEAALANADVQATARGRWHTADPATSPARSRFPGVLDLTANLSRADLRALHRYLPLTVPAEVRAYLGEAVRAGQGRDVSWRIAGDLWNVPFDAPGAAGTFQLAGALDGLDMDYLPSSLQPAGQAPWPGLRGARGQLSIDRAKLDIAQIEAGVAGAPGVRLSAGTLGVDSLHSFTPTLSARWDARGPAREVLDFVQASPLNALTQQALARARITGAVQGEVSLSVPLADLARTRVTGTVQLPGNDLQMTPDTPTLARARGQIVFSETGFAVRNAQARVLGGDLSFEGGLRPDAQGQARLLFRGQGSVTAEGLRDPLLGPLARLAGGASGATTYAAQLGWRGGAPEWQVASSLQGLALALPAPLGKRAETTLPLRAEQAVQVLVGSQAQTDRLQVTLGPAAAPLLDARWERELGERGARVLRGVVALGVEPAEAPAWPGDGVVAAARLAELDVDAWERALAGAGVGAGGVLGGATVAGGDYLPTRLSLDLQQLRVAGRRFERVLAGLSREAGVWRANVEAPELSGYLELRPGQSGAAGSVYARLARLNLATEAGREVEQLLQQPTSVPALDIAVDDFRFGGRSLGQVQAEAINRGAPGRASEWRLTRLSATLPEARLTATGNWALAGGGAGTVRRTALAFTLDIDDAGALLARFGREGVVRGGRGRLDGNIGWLGSPFAIDLPTLSGLVNADIERGQFLKVEPGAGRLLGVLSLQALPRRLVLDFRDVFSQGFAFDVVRGQARVEAGVARTNNLQMKGVNAAVLMEGSADLVREQQDLKVVVVPELNAGTASLLATAINPAIGLGSLLAQLVLRQPLQSATTQEFRITGSWADPQVEKVVRAPAAAAPAPAPPNAPPAPALQ